MKRFRIGNDITITWEVKKNGQALDLSGKIVSLYMTHPKGREVLIEKKADLNDNIITYVLEGLAQKVLGRYTLTIDVREKETAGNEVSEKRILILVGRSCVEEPEETDYTVSL